jgi:6-phosphogluconolactonase
VIPWQKVGEEYLSLDTTGQGSLVIFSIDPDNGRLMPLDRVPRGGKTPRHFAIDPSGKWLFAANQDSNDIVLFRIDPSSGRLLETSRSLKVVSPVCVRIVPVKYRRNTIVEEKKTY